MPIAPYKCLQLPSISTSRSPTHDTGAPITCRFLLSVTLTLIPHPADQNRGDVPLVLMKRGAWLYSVIFAGESAKGDMIQDQFFERTNHNSSSTFYRLRIKWTMFPKTDTQEFQLSYIIYCIYLQRPTYSLADDESERNSSAIFNISPKAWLAGKPITTICTRGGYSDFYTPHVTTEPTDA